MPLGNPDNATNGNKLLILKLKNKDADGKPLMPHAFAVAEKGADGKYVTRPGFENRVAGNLTRVLVTEDEYEGQKYGVVKLTLEDNDAKEAYLLDLRFTQTTRNLFNSLLGLQSFEDVALSLYKSVSKKDGKEYSNISVWQHGKMLRGTIAQADIPKPDEIKDKKGVLIKRDFSEVDAFFSTKLVEFAKRVNSAPRVASKVADGPVVSDTDAPKVVKTRAKKSKPEDNEATPYQDAATSVGQGELASEEAVF